MKRLAIACQEPFPLPADQWRADEPMAKHTTFQIGGPADLMAWPESPADLALALTWADKEDLPVFILGLGSNLLVSDRGMDGLVINMARFNQVSWPEPSLCLAAAGVPLAEVSQAAQAKGMTGLEFACGIPGSLGGAVFMNAGAYDGEMRDVIEWVEVMDGQGQVRRLTNAEMAFAYRHSRLKEEPLYCLAAALRLQPGDPADIALRMAELTHKRESRQPLDMPSAGSVFKRPPGHFAGPLIIESGLQGYTLGGAQVSMKHAGFIVNVGGATAQDVLDLIGHIQQVVAEKTGIALETEVRPVGRPMDGEPSTKK
ncbi:UDP-N-acetylmuramate dehydrogenase [Peptococcus simiae]|uniref:UDP-N-acetylmuramate dehydrogenase n=1 Tax=Peptococcus simiae TaxID=1643805 RepID=UPI0039815013